MSLTVKKLREIINDKGLKEDAFVTDGQCLEFVHITHDTDGNVRLHVDRPIGYCNRTGEYVYPTMLKEKGYSAFCPELNEDLFLFEWTPLDHKGGER